MKRTYLLTMLCALGIVILLKTHSTLAQKPDPISHAEAKGALVAIGGGKISEALRTHVVELAGGWESRILIVPFASSLPNAGPGTARVFEQMGGTDVAVLDLDTNPIEQIEGADLIWLGGGNQSRLADALTTEVVDALRKKYRNGGVIAGTSAGAAVMSHLMLTGKADLGSIRRGTTELVPGFGFYRGIIDQHFHQRQRFNRLLSAVLDHPAFLGIGIDEGTAAVFRGGKLTVRGASTVLLIDASKSRRPKGVSKVKQLHEVSGMQLHVLGSGAEFDLQKRQLIRFGQGDL